MSISFSKLFDPQLLGSSVSTIYTADLAATSVNRGFVVRVTNVTTATRTVTLYAVPSSGSASDTNKIVNKLAVPVNDYVLISVPYLENGDTLQGLADAASSLNIQFEKGDAYTA